MSTPTTSAALSSQSQSQKRPQGGPSTPSATNVLTPRSHPTPSTGLPTQTNSPSALRTAASPAQRGGLQGLAHAQLAGKSPAQQGTPGRHVAAKSILGAGATMASPTATRSTPASQNGTATGMVSAPSTGSNALNISHNFESPSAMGSLGLAGGIGMSMSLSSLGFSLSNAGSGQLDEQERMRRLEQVIALLGQSHGRLSRDNLSRLGRRYGFEEVIDDFFLKNEDSTLYFAGGNHVVVEIECEDKQSSAVKKVGVTFSNLNDAVTEHQEAAGKVLLQDLKQDPKSVSRYIILDKFADNLERLSRLHRLSVPGANCFEAIAGVYNSLRKLFENQKQYVEEQSQETQPHVAWKLEREVMCKRCGKPRMHARKRLGLSLDYWMHRRLISPSPDTTSSTADSDDPTAEDPDKIASIIIECDYTAPSLMYPRIRVTDNWISEAISKPPDQGEAALGMPAIEPIIEWLDPEAPLVPAVDPQTSNPGASTNPGLPKAHFVAKLEPAVPMPVELAVEIHATVGLNADIADTFSTTQAILGDLLPAEYFSNPIKVSRHLTIYSNNTEEEQEYRFGLFCSNQSAMVKLAQVPFQHPRQVISFLPVLRQWAFTAKLLQNTFRPDASGSPEQKLRTDGSANGIATRNGDRGLPTRLREMELDELLNDSLPPSDWKADVEMRIQAGLPQFTVTIPGSEWPRSISFDVRPNADIFIGEQTVIDEDADDRERKLKGLTEALTTCEDIGIWVQWIKQRMGQSW